VIVLQVLTALATLTALLVGGTTPYFILYFFVHQVRILKLDRRPILAKGIVSFFVWLSLTFVILSLFFFDIYGDRFEDVDRVESTATMERAQRLIFLLVVTLLYSLACSGLFYWMKRRSAKPRHAERAELR
jgi:hypothetical protein